MAWKYFVCCYEGNPKVTCGLPSQMVSYVGAFALSLLLARKVTWGALKLMWCHFNGMGPKHTSRPVTLQWRHNECDGVSNHQPHDCLFNRLFRLRSKKTSKLRLTDLCAGNWPVTGEFPAQRASNAENVSIWWSHNAININPLYTVDAIRHPIPLPSLVPVMACCLTAPSHYLNHCWLIVIWALRDTLQCSHLMLN